MTIERDKILSKIRGLLAKTLEAGATEPEAMAALEMAQNMMTAYEVTEAELKNFIAGKSLPASTGAEAREPLSVRKSTGSGNREFGILDHLDKDQLRTVGRNYVTRCPSCAEGGERSRWR